MKSKLKRLKGVPVYFLAAFAAVLTAFFIVGNNQCVLIKHHALETRIWSHVDADLLA